MRSALDFGVRIMLANILGWVWKQSDNALIGWRWGSVDLGYYARAYSILLMPLALISGPIASAVIPALSRLQEQKEEWASLFTRTARIVTSMSALIAAVLYVNANFVVDIALGPGWDESKLIFAVLSLSILPSIAWELSRFVFLSLGRSDVMLKYSMVAGPLFLASFAFGLQFGAIGVAWALTAISWLLAVPILIVSARTADISSLRLIIDLLPPVLGFAAAIVAGELAAAFDGTELWRALVTGTLATLAFVIAVLGSGLFIGSWRSDARAVSRWVGRRLGARSL